MSRKYEIKKAKMLYEAQKAYVDKLLSFIDGNEPNNDFKDWLNKQLISAKLEERVRQDIYKKMVPETYKDLNYLEIKLEGVKAKMKVYDEHLKSCDDETEGKLLSALIKLKKNKEHLETEIKSLIEKDAPKDIPEELDTSHVEVDKEAMVQAAVDGVDIQGMSTKLGIPEEDCYNELKNCILNALSKAIDSNKNQTGLSKHFMVQIIKLPDDNFAIKVFGKK